jgi:hypothetical protein
VPPRERALLARATEDASVSAFHLGLGIAALLVAGGGVLGAVGIVNPRRDLHACDCPGGQLAGAPREAGGPDGTGMPSSVTAAAGEPRTGEP